VLHLASPASPVDYAALPLETLAVNSRGTEHCLAAAREWGARFLFASTSECYGDPKEHPQAETYWGNVNSIGPRSCYDEAKRFGEALTMAYARAHDVDVRIIRIFNTYGPRMRRNDGRVVPNFITQAIGGVPLTIYGDGQQTRSFCYVSDLVDGIIRCAASPRTRGIVVNLGNPVEHTIREFAEIVARIAGVDLRVEMRPMPVDDPGRRRPDITRACSLLEWEPVIELEDGLRRTIDAFRAQARRKVPA
jgi:nucleoside-diphosphate-sugar epimerase